MQLLIGNKSPAGGDNRRCGKELLYSLLYLDLTSDFGGCEKEISITAGTGLGYKYEMS